MRDLCQAFTVNQGLASGALKFSSGHSPNPHHAHNRLEPTDKLRLIKHAERDPKLSASVVLTRREPSWQHCLCVLPTYTSLFLYFARSFAPRYIGGAACVFGFRLLYINLSTSNLPGTDMLSEIYSNLHVHQCPQTQLSNVTMFKI